MKVGAIQIPQILSEGASRTAAPLEAALLTDQADVARNISNLSGPDGRLLDDVMTTVETKRASGLERALRAEEARLSGASEGATLLLRLVDEVSSRNGGVLSEHDRGVMRTLTEAIDGQSRMMEASRQHINALQQAINARPPELS